MPVALLVTGVDGFLVALSPNPKMKPGFWEESLERRDGQPAFLKPKQPEVEESKFILSSFPKTVWHSLGKLWSSLDWAGMWFSGRGWLSIKGPGSIPGITNETKQKSSLH